MTTNHGNVGALRHRRKSPSKNDNTAMASNSSGDDLEPLLSSESSPCQVENDTDDGDHHHHSDGYKLTPLVERSMLARLDVAPYFVGYALLIYLDHVLGVRDVKDDNKNFNLSILLHPTTWAFAVLLLSHVMLILMQQWNVHVRSLVGYKRASQNVKKGSNVEAVIASWTHCLVEQGSSATSIQSGGKNASQASAPADNASEAGIAPVTIHQASNFCVAIVDYHDIFFRCPTVSKSQDDDVTLWKNLGAKSAIAKQSSSVLRSKLVFHRVRFPVNLSPSFYGSWTGHATLDSVKQCQNLYGANATILELPTFMELLSQQVVAPFFLFQIFCVGLWSLDEYWYYAIFTLLALLSFESTVAYNRQQSLQRLRNASRQNNRYIWVHRKGFGIQTKSTNTPSWVRITAREIVPGDIVSLSSELEASDRMSELRNNKSHQHNTVPADILLLKGNAVVDEALLTGESIPQIKVQFDPSTTVSSSGQMKTEEHFDIQEHKESMLFGGTMLLTADYGERDDNATLKKNKEGKDDPCDNNIPRPPDDGVVGMALRTGFETAQGSLLRTIAHSSKSVDGVHTRDTFVFIFLLVCCAIASASLVLQDGWDDVTRNRFRLTLHVIIIITSVVPPELPMELSLAVTNSVADLMKRCQVYCTEHYRIPWAGLVNVCCFDKTGTLTSDQMCLKGIRLFTDDDLEHLDEESALVSPREEDPEILPWSVVRVMAGCHSLALRSTRGKKAARPQVIGDPLEQAVLKDTGYQLVGNNMLIPSRSLPGRPNSITILHRFAFASHLKRMTVLVTEENSADYDNDKGAMVWALTKGAPETLYQLLCPESIPADYDEISTYHMSRGRRVLAMGYRPLGKGRSVRALKEQGRENIEANLLFSGFLVLDCPLKPDSKDVIAEIRKSDHRAVMITGDAVLTAAEVAGQVGIIDTVRDARNHMTYWLQPLPGNSPSVAPGEYLSSFAFTPLLPQKNTSTKESGLVLSAGKIAKIQEMMQQGHASFCLTGDMLVQVAFAAVSSGVSGANGKSVLSRMNEKSLLLHPRAQGALKELVKVVSVFARHAPHQKEAVVAAFNLSGSYTLYCGDGTNDTPSLKRAHVGISIISAPDAEFKQRKANASLSQLRAEHKRARKVQKKGKKVAGNITARTQSMEESLRLLREAQDEIDNVELGDASVASPFTSKQVSIVCCKHVLQQGRCTLVTMLQIYKILGINCLVNAMVLSTLSIHGVKQGDRQLTVLGTVVAALFFFVTRAKPLDTLSDARPPSSVLCLQALLSIALQFAIHFATILLACTAALSFVDPFDPSIVADGPFNPNVLNTCTFMLTVLATINTFAVNYRGRPFTENLRENTLLMRSLLACYASLFLCAFEAFPPLNDLLQLSTFPDQDAVGSGSAPSSSLDLAISNLLHLLGFPTFICLLMVFDTFLSFLVERTIIRAFEG